MTEAFFTAESKCHCDDTAARDAMQLRARDSILLSQLIGVLAAPLDCHEALRQVACLLVPQIADLAAIDILSDDGTPQRGGGRARHKPGYGDSRAPDCR